MRHRIAARRGQHDVVIGCGAVQARVWCTVRQLKGSGARSNGSGEAPPAPSCPLRPSKNKRCTPAGCRAEPYCFFSTGITLSEASVIPVGFFPFPSHGRSPWVFYSFCRGSRALPMLSFFHIGGPCGERESFRTRILGSYKDSKPSLLPAFREQQRGKEKRKEWGLFAPKPPTRMSVGRNGHDGSAGASPDPLLLVPGPDQWAHRIQDTQTNSDSYESCRQLCSPNRQSIDSQCRLPHPDRDALPVLATSANTVI